MQKTLFFAGGAAVGFVLGTRAGKHTYEKMKNQSVELLHNPTVQEKVSGATETVKSGAPKLQQKVGALAKKATHRDTDGTETSAVAVDSTAETPLARSTTAVPAEATTPAPVVEPAVSPSTGEKPTS